MIEDKRILAVIPARGGSKGVPRKNIRPVCNKPLLAYSIENARRSRYLDEIVVSTEDDEIAEIAVSLGVDIVKRPSCLSDDHTPSIEPVLHAISECSNFDLVVLLQPTSPLRSEYDIDGALEFFSSSNSPACVSMCKAPVPPHRLFTVNQNICHRYMPGVVSRQRQDWPDFYIVNGAIYIADVKWLMRSRSFLSDNTMAYVMSEENSLDIDTELDIRLFEFLLKNRTH